MRGLPQKQNARRADKIRLCGHLGRYKKIVKKTYIIYIKFLYEIEAGRKGFSANVLYKISKALNVSCDYILNDSNQQTVPDFIIELVKKLDSKEQVAVEHILVEIIRLREE